MTIEIDVATEDYLSRLKNSLTVSAVLKAELASFKSTCGDSKVFAYEGVTDKVIYAHWIAKTHCDLDYEPFICRNKAQLLQLFNSLKYDLTGMNENVYFFIDRDFDDLRGYESSESIFMTEKYSIENYLVDKGILDDLLKIEFHCHGNPDIRQKIISIFETTYDAFLKNTLQANFRIYLARKCKIRQSGDLAIRLDDLADIHLQTVNVGAGVLSLMVCLEKEPSELEIAEHKESFASLEPRNHYRGKFALQFFRKWLTLLLADRNSEDSLLFHGVPQADFVAKSAFSFDQFAAKSKPPESFQLFIRNILGGNGEKTATA